MGKDNKGLRSLTWDDYGITKGRYKELQGFCLQYRQKKKEAKRLGFRTVVIYGEHEADEFVREVRYWIGKGGEDR